MKYYMVKDFVLCPAHRKIVRSVLRTAGEETAVRRVGLATVSALQHKGDVRCHGNNTTARSSILHLDS